MSAEPKDVRLPLMVTKSEAEAIDEWRYDHRIPSRAEAIRRLIAVGIASYSAARAISATLQPTSMDPVHYARPLLERSPHAAQLLDGLETLMGDRTNAEWAFGDNNIEIMKDRAEAAQFLARYLINMAEGNDDPVPHT